MSPRGVRKDLLAIAMALPEPTERDWVPGASRQTGTNLRVTADTAVAAQLRTARLVEVLQAPQRGRAPAAGRIKYILKVYPNADAPATQPTQGNGRRSIAVGKGKRIPWYLLASLAEAALNEYRRQQSSISKQLDEEVASIEVQLRSTNDRMEKKRLADALQTALHADERLDAEIAKRVYAKLANSEEEYSRYVDAIDWNVRTNGARA
jgi:hypothetical protein